MARPGPRGAGDPSLQAVQVAQGCARRPADGARTDGTAAGPGARDRPAPAARARLRAPQSGARPPKKTIRFRSYIPYYTTTRLHSASAIVPLLPSNARQPNNHSLQKWCKIPSAMFKVAIAVEHLPAVCAG